MTGQSIVHDMPLSLMNGTVLSVEEACLSRCLEYDLKLRLLKCDSLRLGDFKMLH